MINSDIKDVINKINLNQTKHQDIIDRSMTRLSTCLVMPMCNLTK